MLRISPDRLAVLNPNICFLRPNYKMVFHTTALEKLAAWNIPACQRNVDLWVLDALRYGWQGIIDVCKESNPCSINKIV